MRIANQVRLLAGAKRSAAYDFSSGIVWHCTSLEVSIMEWIAAGEDWQSFPGSHRNIAFAVRSLSRKGLLVAGVQKKAVLDFPFERYQRPTTTPRLKHIWFELTNACNLTCDHCYAGSSPQADRSGELDQAAWKVVIEELSGVGVDIITYIGGEPTLRLKEIQSLLEYVRDTLPGTKQRIFSNLAIRGIGSKISKFAMANKIGIGTSLYGLEPSQHDTMTHRRGSWTATVDNISTLRRNGVEVFVGFYMSPHTEQNQAIIRKWLISLGVIDFEILTPSLVGRGAAKEWGQPRKESGVPPEKMHFNIDDRHYMGGHNCFKDHLAVAPNGDVRPCIMMRDVKYNVEGQKAQIVNSLQSREFSYISSLGKDKIKGCSVCEFRFGCFDCRPDAMGGTGDLLAKPNCGYDPRV